MKQIMWPAIDNFHVPDTEICKEIRNLNIWQCEVITRSYRWFLFKPNKHTGAGLYVSDTKVKFDFVYISFYKQVMELAGSPLTELAHEDFFDRELAYVGTMSLGDKLRFIESKVDRPVFETLIFNLHLLRRTSW